MVGMQLKFVVLILKPVLTLQFDSESLLKESTPIQEISLQSIVIQVIQYLLTLYLC